MTDDSEHPAAPSDKTKRIPLPSLKGIGSFLVNVLALERSVEALKAHNKQLDDQILALQRQVDDQAGQLKVLVNSFKHLYAIRSTAVRSVPSSMF